MSSHNYLDNKVNPYWQPPIEALWFDHLENTVLASGASQTIIDFNLPLSSIGTVRWFGQDVYFPNPTSYDDIEWQILVNNGPDIIYGKIVGLISRVYDPTDIMIKLPRAANVKLTIKNTGLSSISLRGRLKGWYWVEHAN